VTILDMNALPGAQQLVLSAIAIGHDRGHHERTLQALAGKGLIVGHRVLLPGTPPVEIVRWEVPLDVHIQWAAWCAEQPDEDDA
jgi:phosphomannomutase